MIKLSQFIISSFWNKLIYILEILQLLIFSFEHLFVHGRRERKIIIPLIYKQILFTGFDAIKLIGLIALVFGGIILFLGESLSKTVIFDKNLLGIMMSQILLRELAPLITAIIIIGRSATAVATEIGNMKVNQEIEAIESMGIDPVHFLVVPRIMGMTISLVVLVIYFFFIGLIGGFIFSALFFNFNLPFDEYLGIVFAQMEISDISLALIKSLFFGLFIAAIACYKGMKIPNSITFVPVVATQTVVSSMSVVFFLYAYFTILYFI